MRVRNVKQAIWSVSLVTTSFFFLWLFLRGSRTTPKQNDSTSPSALLRMEVEQEGESDSLTECPEADAGSDSDADLSDFVSKGAQVTSSDGYRHWKNIGPVVDPQANLLALSPYNGRNKRRRLTKRFNPDAEPKVILWMASKTIKVMHDTTSMFRKCSVSACMVSPVKTIGKQAAAVVYDDDKMARHEPLSPSEDRVQIYYSMRTPNDVLSDAELKASMQNLTWKSAINWVWSYRPDSDIFEPFGYFQNSGESITDDINMIMRKKTEAALVITPEVKAGHKDDKSLHEGMSHTGVEAYLKAMKGTMSFDTMSMVELREALKDRSFTLSEYYFIIAFEWVNCPDYVTDLYFLSLDPRIHAIPVVRGGFKYSEYLPTETFINADDFRGPEDLALYLKRLAMPTKPYIDMLKKKSKYKQEDGIHHAWCQLCDMLHHIKEDHHLLDPIDDIQAWFMEGAQCKASDIRRVKQMKKARDGSRATAYTHDDTRRAEGSRRSPDIVVGMRRERN